MRPIVIVTKNWSDFVMNPVEKLALLRAEMAKRHINAYVVVTDDFHASEYAGAHFKAREFLSGFTGSAGTLVVLPDAAALWTDGRYFLQASQQLEGSGIELMRMGQPGVPEIPAFLRDHVPENGWIGFDSRTISNDFARSIGEKTREKHIRFAGDEDLVDLVWADRPALSCEPVWELDVKYAGLDAQGKARNGARQDEGDGRKRVRHPLSRRGRVAAESARQRRALHTCVPLVSAA